MNISTLSRVALRASVACAIVGGLAISSARADLARAEGWLPIVNDAPSLALDRKVVFDTRRGVMVLFAGNFENRQSGTWEWDDGGWFFRTSDGPEFRQGAALAYDSGRGVVVLFGGKSGGGNALADTWEWDGATWTQVVATGPSARYDHSLSYDAARGVVVLFGGRVFESGRDKLLRDTWEWDGENWTQKSFSGPSARFSHAMTFDAIRGKTILFGGFARTYQGDTWTWDGERWARVSFGGPDSRLGAAAAWDSINNRVLLFGGRGSGGLYFSDLWSWDGSSWDEVDAADGPGVREGAGVAFDGLRGHLFIAGGSNDETTFRDYWVYSTDGWNQWKLSPAPPIGLDWRAVFDESASTMVLNHGPTSQTWQWNGVEWSHIDSDGSPGFTLELYFNADRDQVDGYDAENQRLYTWNGALWTKVLVGTTGPARSGPLVYDRARSQALALGTDSTWIYDGKTWSVQNVDGPYDRENYVLAYDEDRSRTVLFGGQRDGQLLSDVWEWDGETWALVEADGPTGRRDAAFAYDVNRGVCVLFGGSTQEYGAVDETWLWDGASWTHSPEAGPGPRAGTAMVYDRARERMVAFDGHFSRESLPWDWFDDLWEHGQSDTILADADCDGDIDFADIYGFEDAIYNDFAYYTSGTGTLECWQQRGRWGDLNRDGVVTPADVDEFVRILIESQGQGFKAKNEFEPGMKKKK